MAETDQQSTIDDIKAKIEQNSQILDKAIQLRNVLEDKNSLAQCEAHIRQSGKYIAYLNDELQQVQGRSSSSRRHAEKRERRSLGSSSSGSNSSSGNDGSSLFQARPGRKWTSLDLLKADIPINRTKVTRRFKDLNSRLDAQESLRRLGDPGVNREELQETIVLLRKAIRKYQCIDIRNDPAAATEQGYDETCAYETALLPAAGKLRLKIIEARDLTHAPSHSVRAPQTFVAVQVNNRRQGKTRCSRGSIWSDTFEMDVNMAAEIELIVYHRAGGDKEVMIGLLWFKMADIAEELRQKKARLVQSEAEGRNSLDSACTSSACTISDWFDVEPSGRILVQLSFVRRGENVRPFNKLMRTGAFREPEGRVYVCNEHTFVTKRFYQTMRCAICRDYIVNVTYQCEDCLLGCHKQCYERVPFICLAQISAANQNTNSYVFKDMKLEIKFNIPHRFETTMFLGTNRCAHCGLMLLLAVKPVKKCTECGFMCHSKCATFVPNFCSIDMETAYSMLIELKDIDERQRSSLRREEITSRDMSLLSPLGNSRGSFYNLSLTPSRESARLDKISRSSAISQHRHHADEVGQATVTMATPKTTSPISVYSKMTLLHINQGTSIDDFNFLAVLGRGNFGKVMLAENKYTRDLYAIKVLKKISVLMQNDFNCRYSVLAEKHVFTIANQGYHPFLVRLHSTFMTESRLFFVMEYVPGGDLMFHIQGRNFTEPRARFYSAEILLALEHLHMNGVIYRDLKLDNVVLDANGHVKLTDYGLSKGDMYYGTTTGTYCGTPEFMAPEILNNQRYTRAVDWWALGVLLYEMLVGQAPFRAETDDEMFEAIMHDEIVCPASLSQNAQSLVHALLQKDPGLRLGSGKTDGMEVRAHEFYEDVKWDELLAKRVPPPFMPTIQSRADTSNFEHEFTGQFPMLTPVQTVLSAQDQHQFYGFDYISDWALADTRQINK